MHANGPSLSARAASYGSDRPRAPAISRPVDGAPTGRNTTCVHFVPARWSAWPSRRLAPRESAAPITDR